MQRMESQAVRARRSCRVKEIGENSCEELSKEDESRNALGSGGWSFLQQTETQTPIECLTNARDDKQDKERVDDRLNRRRQRADDVLEGLDPAEEPHHSERVKEGIGKPQVT